MHMERIRGVYLMDTARVLGDVTVGEDTNLWCGAAVRGDVAPVTIGARCNLQDGVIAHCDDDIPLVIGDDVSMGHGAIVHCVSVGDGTLVVIASRILAGCVIGKGCLIAAGCVVPPNTIVPDGMVVMGVPGRIMSPVRPDEAAYLKMIPGRYVGLARLHHEHPNDPRTRPWKAES
jgi:carbonic anhydrase/acetyltransferase-like protein (isoleucine patch superfamily)